MNLKKYLIPVFFLAFLSMACDKNNPELPEGTEAIQGHWVLDVDASDEVIKVYIPFDENMEIDMHIKYGGIQFFEDQKFQDHFWLFCGTPPIPPDIIGVYTLTVDEGVTTLKISIPKWEDQNFEVLAISAEKLKLKVL